MNVINEKIMGRKFLLLVIIVTMLVSCKKEKEIIDLPSPPTVLSQTVLIKDVVLSHLPSPFYHFEYNATGKVTFVSYASDFFRYDVIYDGDRISEMRNNILVNKDRLQYFYDKENRVTAVNYTDATGLVYIKTNLTYDGSRLIKLERERKLAANFIIDKTITMTYYADGNLHDRTVHYPAMVGQPEVTFSDRFEQYDGKINAQGFSLLHDDEFFDHFVFLPEVVLQKNNPGKQTRIGDGDNFTVDYTYTYNDSHAPITRSGDFVYTSGPTIGQRILLSSTYTYYQ